MAAVAGARVRRRRQHDAALLGREVHHKLLGVGRRRLQPHAASAWLPDVAASGFASSTTRALDIPFFRPDHASLRHGNSMLAGPRLAPPRFQCVPHAARTSSRSVRRTRLRSRPTPSASRRGRWSCRAARRAASRRRPSGTRRSPRSSPPPPPPPPRRRSRGRRAASCGLHPQLHHHRVADRRHELVRDRPRHVAQDDDRVVLRVDDLLGVDGRQQRLGSSARKWAGSG